MVEEQGKTIDMEAYEKAKQHSIAMSQTSGSIVDDRLSLDVHSISELQNQGFKPTNDMPKYCYESKNGIYGTFLLYILLFFCLFFFDPTRPAETHALNLMILHSIQNIFHAF